VDARAAHGAGGVMGPHGARPKSAMKEPCGGGRSDRQHLFSGQSDCLGVWSDCQRRSAVGISEEHEVLTVV
jgi:hypothetical protein